jgi:hypothetical protein
MNDTISIKEIREMNWVPPALVNEANAANALAQALFVSTIKRRGNVSPKMQAAIEKVQASLDKLNSE